jgi:hypothetical protein
VHQNTVLREATQSLHHFSVYTAFVTRIFVFLCPQKTCFIEKLLAFHFLLRLGPIRIIGDLVNRPSDNRGSTVL